MTFRNIRLRTLPLTARYGAMTLSPDRSGTTVDTFLVSDDCRAGSSTQQWRTPQQVARHGAIVGLDNKCPDRDWPDSGDGGHRYVQLWQCLGNDHRRWIVR